MSSKSIEMLLIALRSVTADGRRAHARVRGVRQTEGAMIAEYSQPDVIRRVLTQTHTWAVVGCSPDPDRDSHRIADLLRRRGFRVIAVNPAVDQLFGERCYPSVTAIPSSEGVEV